MKQIKINKKTSPKYRQNLQKKVFEAVQADPTISIKELSNKLHASRTTLSQHYNKARILLI